MLGGVAEHDGRIFERAAEAIGALPCEAVLPGDRPLESTTPDADLRTAANLLWWRKVGALPVLEDGRLVGCFAEEDLLRALAQRLAGGDAAASADGRLGVWDAVLAKTTVREAMTPVERLPVAEPGATLLGALRESVADDGSHGRYLFLVDESEGQRVRLASFRDVARTLTTLYDGQGSLGALGGDAADRARHATQGVLGLPIGSVRRSKAFGHEPRVVASTLNVAEAIQAMWSGGRGYVIVTTPEGEPMGIFTRRDVLRACVPRYADLAALPLAGAMSRRVRTVTETVTLCGLFKLMALESCRHMPLVDDWDRVQSVISMWETVSLLVGEAP